MENKFNFKHPDLHMHSIFSDGSDDAKSLIEAVKKANIDIFALTDHDCYDGCAKVEELLQDNDPFFICGVELSCEDEEGKYHILGYSYDVNKPSIKDAIELTHAQRLRKVIHRIEYLRNVEHYDITKEDEEKILANKNPGKPHLAKLLLEKGFVKEKKEAFELIDKYEEPERRLRPEEAIDAILQADGIPVLAHGIFGGGSQLLTKEEIDNRVKRLKSVGLMGLECFYSTYSEEQKNIMLSLADKYNLLITAGSDYHGLNKTVTIGDTGNINPEKLERFYQAVKRLILERKR